MPKATADAQLWNAKQFKKVLDELPQKIRGRIMRDATKKACKPVVKFMKKEIPNRLNFNKKTDSNPKDLTLKGLKRSIASKVKTYGSGKQKGATYAVIGPRTGEKYRSGQILVKFGGGTKGTHITAGTVLEYGWNMQPLTYNKDTLKFMQHAFPRYLKRELGPAIQKEGKRIADKHKANKKLSSSEQKVLGKI